MSRKLVSVPAAPSLAWLQRADNRAVDRTLAAFEQHLATGQAPQAPPQVVLRPVDATSPNRDSLRPTTLQDTIGQDELKPLLGRLIANAKVERRPLDPLLFVGASGTGKTTLATVVASELGQRVFNLKAPLDINTLNALRTQAHDLDVVFIDEVHMQVSGDRRGLTAACDPESFYALLEDGVLSTATGPLPFPKVSWIGATTDVGLLPEPLSARFPLQPQLAPYTREDMVRIADRSIRTLHLEPGPEAAHTFANASRGNPRQVNAYVRAGRGLARDGRLDDDLAVEVVTALCSTTLDGLSRSQQTVLTFLYRHCARKTKDGVVYQASVNALATAAGHGRDTKAISLLVESYLIQRGLLTVQPRGRTLTDAGIARAQQLIGDTDA